MENPQQRTQSPTRSSRAHQPTQQQLKSPKASTMKQPMGLLDVERLDEPLDCPLCCSVFTTPKLLPCGHTFCLHCLQKAVGAASAAGGPSPTDGQHCPLCFVDFSGAVDALPANVYVDTLIGMKGGSRGGTAVELHGGDCQKVTASLAAGGSPTERRMRSPSPPRSGSPSPRKRRWSQQRVVEATPSNKSQQESCQNHPAKPVTIFCSECEEPSCESCFIQRHNGHRFADIADAARDYIDQLGKDAEKVATAIVECLDRQHRIEELKLQLTDSARSTEDAIGEEAASLRRSVDQEAAELRLQLKAIRNERTAELRQAKDNVDAQMAQLQSSVSRCEIVRNGGTPTEVVTNFKTLHRAAVELPLAVSSLASPPPFHVAFRPSDFRRFMPQRLTNLVGTVTLNELRGRPTGEAASTSSAGGANVEPRSWAELGDRLRRLEAEKSELMRQTSTSIASLNRQLESADEREQDLRDQLQLTERQLRRIERAKMTATLVYTLKVYMSNFAIRGVALLNGELYVLRVGRKSTDIAVYELADMTLQRRLNVDQLALAHDLASCARRSVLYVSDMGNDAVHRVDPSGNSISWPVDDKPSGLSVTPSAGNVLVTCFVRLTLKEFSPVGHLVRQISLQPDVVYPWHAVELAAGARYAVCHGNGDDSAHRVCVVSGVDGATLTMHGGARGSATGLLSGPLHMALADDGFVFAVDNDNRRVVLLDPDVVFVSDLLTAESGLKDPRRLHWDASTKRLYVAEGVGSVLVFQLM